MVKLDGTNLELPPKEFALLYTIASNPKRVSTTYDMAILQVCHEFRGI